MKKKKLAALAMALAMAFALPLTAFAETTEIDIELEGYITELVEGGFIMEDIALGQVLLNVDDQTVLDGLLLESDIEAGLYVIVTYDGRMTRSLPPQAHADRVGCYMLNGVVSELMENNVVLINDEFFGDVLVHVPFSTAHLYPDMPITVYYDGVMALSEPGQVAARELIIPELSGVISDLDAEGFTLTQEDGTAYRVLVTDETLIGELVAQDPDSLDEAASIETAASAPDAAQASEPPALADAPASDPEAEASPNKEAEAATEPTEAAADGEALSHEASEEISDPDSALLVTDFEIIDYSRALEEGDQVTVYYNGHLSDDAFPQLAALEVLAILESR